MKSARAAFIEHDDLSGDEMAKRTEAGTRDRASMEGETEIARDRATMTALRASDKLYYRIGEVSKLTGVKAHVLRYWETEFRWMAPPKSRAKQRLYRRRDIEFVWLLKRLLWEERYTIAGARQRIQELGVENALALLQEPAEEAPAKAVSATEGGKEASKSERDWTSFRTALDAMQSDLVALRGVLQEGA